MSPRRQRLRIGIWAGLLALLAGFVLLRLEVSGDLRMFMPAPRTEAQHLLLDLVGDGPGSRLLLVALHGRDSAELAAESQALRTRLGAAPEFRRVLNGSEELAEVIDEQLLPYRYLLSPGFDQAALDAAVLARALRARLADLGSPAAALVEPWLGRDPTLELLRLAESWQPQVEPQRAYDVWFSADLGAALLLLETTAGGFDPAGQRAALARLRLEFEALAAPGVRLEVSGPGAFAARMQEQTQDEAAQLGLASSVGMLLLLGMAYRSSRLPLLGALPLASAALAGLAAVSLLSGGPVHGITLAFGFTLIGVAQDYPVHLFSHMRPGHSAGRVVRALWPTLSTGVIATCLAYLSFFAAGVEGLRQLALFTIAGLLVAAACTRWLLPALLPAPQLDLAQAPLVHALWRAMQVRPGLRWLALAPALAAAGWLAWSPAPFWNDDLAALTPLPPELLARDRQLRAELGAPDVRWLLVLKAADQERVLQASEALEPELRRLVAQGVLESYDLPSRWLPSRRTQLRRQAALPAPEALRAMLRSASTGLPFRSAIFLPFLADVEAARLLQPLQADRLAGTLAGARIEALLPPPGDSGTARALVSLGGVADVAALAAFAATVPGEVLLLDLKSASESLAAAWRERVLLALAVALVLLVATVWLSLRGWRRVLRVLAPVLLSGLLVVALLNAGGVSFNLFHLVALILGAGLGLDYALFFEHAGSEPTSQRRTLHAVLVCAASTALVFGLLATSTIPVLRAIGQTVGLAVLCNFLLAALLAGALNAPGVGVEHRPIHVPPPRRSRGPGA